ncbi:MAG: hypothetical protein DRH97_00165 [Chloroflexi bacterium]|nr:MAG: hypothetical protein DRH97_00165 [Chloroflexota bacterium]
MSQVIGKLRVRVDEIELTDIVANSIMLNYGNAPSDFKGTESGGFVTSDNLEEALGHIKIDMYSTEQNVKDINALERRPVVSIVVWSDDSDFQTTMRGKSTNANGEFSTGSDGKKTLEFKGSKLT